MPLNLWNGGEAHEFFYSSTETSPCNCARHFNRDSRWIIPQATLRFFVDVRTRNTWSDLDTVLFSIEHNKTLEMAWHTEMGIVFKLHSWSLEPTSRVFTSKNSSVGPNMRDEWYTLRRFPYLGNIYPLDSDLVTSYDFNCVFFIGKRKEINIQVQ